MFDHLMQVGPRNWLDPLDVQEVGIVGTGLVFWLKPGGAGNKTTIQLVDLPPDIVVRFGIHLPEPPKPTLEVAAMQEVDRLLGSETEVVVVASPWWRTPLPPNLWQFVVLLALVCAVGTFIQAVR